MEMRIIDNGSSKSSSNLPLMKMLPCIGSELERQEPRDILHQRHGRPQDGTPPRAQDFDDGFNDSKIGSYLQTL